MNRYKIRYTLGFFKLTIPNRAKLEFFKNKKEEKKLVKYYEYKNEPFTDSFGNSYSGVHYYYDLFQSLNNQNPCSIFNLKGEYANFSGSIVATPETNSDYTYYVSIYVDDSLVFSQTGISKTGGKVDFNVDVTNGQKLEIRMGTEAKLGHYDGELGIVNAFVK